MVVAYNPGVADEMARYRLSFTVFNSMWINNILSALPAFGGFIFGRTLQHCFLPG